MFCSRVMTVAMVTVGVVGLGPVGWAVVHGLSRYNECSVYDIDGDFDWAPILGSSVTFVCVGTPGGLDSHLDCSAVYQVLTRLAEADYRSPVVVKSTVRVGFMAEAVAKFPRLRLVYMPEFLRERSRFTWFLQPDRLLLSGQSVDVEEVLTYFDWVKGASIIKTDHRTAEVAKLAHNAYIATKVSFTNEMESIAEVTGADPKTVMEVVTADRRVLSDAHLRPRMGAYGGKCVPKDTSELAEAGGPSTRLLRAVQEVRETASLTTVDSTRSPIVVLIPTRNRPKKLERALSSVARQTRSPDAVVVVSDCDPHEEVVTGEVVQLFLDRLPVKLLHNSRTPNLSGALNTGIACVGEAGFSASQTFLALLDDDDWWDRSYLDNVTTFAAETEADWVVSGLLRHEAEGAGKSQPIPARLAVDDFLVTNPNVQGSNLFVRLSRIQEAGGFDEGLPSTTDRDLCIRLLKLPGIRYEVLRNHLVHHDASPDASRLSAPGSPIKKAGLDAFYRKYSSMMTPEQRTRFRERASLLFRVDVTADA